MNPQVTRCFALVVWMVSALTSGHASSEPAHPEVGSDSTLQLAGDAGARRQPFVAALACAQAHKKVILVAHLARASNLQPENSASGIIAALEAGATAIEIDVRRSTDGVLFLHHDDTLSRTTTASGRSAAATWGTLSQAYLKRDDGRVSNDHPLRLSEAFALTSGDTFFLLDLKDIAATEQIVNETVAAGRHKQTLFIAYNLEQARVIRDVLPDALLALGANDRERLTSIRNAKLAPPIVGLMGSVVEPDNGLVQEAHDLGYFLLGSTYVGDSSLEHTLERKPEGQGLVPLQSGFSLWVTNRAERVARYLAATNLQMATSELVSAHDAPTLSHSCK